MKNTLLACLLLLVGVAQGATRLGDTVAPVAGSSYPVTTEEYHYGGWHSGTNSATLAAHLIKTGMAYYDTATSNLYVRGPSGWVLFSGGDIDASTVSNIAAAAVAPYSGALTNYIPRVPSFTYVSATAITLSNALWHAIPALGTNTTITFVGAGKAKEAVTVDVINLGLKQITWAGIDSWACPIPADATNTVTIYPYTNGTWRGIGQ